MHKHAVKVVFAGRVQGVGFRYTTISIAGGFQISGYIKNLPNGNVELLAQGNEGEVDTFVDAICRRMVRYIHSQTINIVPSNPNIKDFRITY